MYIPKKLDFINAVLLLLWVTPPALPSVAKEVGFGAKPQISKIKYYKENLNDENN